MMTSDASHREPLRVTHVIPQIGVGGAERQLFELIRRSDPRQVTHRVLYFSDSKDEDQLALYAQAGVDVRRVPRRRNRPLRFVGDLARALRHGAPHIVQCWLYSGTVWGRLGAIRAGARRIIITHRGTMLVHVRVLRILERLTSRRLVYVANTAACAKSVGERIGVDPGRFRVIHNGIDLSPYDEPPDRARLRRELGLSEDARLVVCVGRLTWAKNYPMLLRVAKRSQGVLPFRFLIVGHGELEADLRRQAADLGVEETVRFLGLRHDVPRILRAADCFCFTSRTEGFPNALLEAMAAALPIVTTDFPGVREVLEDGVHGTILPSDDDEAAFRALRRYHEDAAHAQRLAAQARTRAERCFSMDAMVRNTLAYYRELVGEMR